MARAIIHIVRHGETDANRQKIFQGQLDTDLNANGLDQARQVADTLRSIPFDVAFSSDLSRAVSYVCWLIHAWLITTTSRPLRRFWSTTQQSSFKS
jgi:bisphosphoglycerate-dependent phosphoglycerate mutase